MYECGHLRSAVYYSEQRTKSKEKKRECVIEFVHKSSFLKYKYYRDYTK